MTSPSATLWRLAAVALFLAAEAAGAYAQPSAALYLNSAPPPGMARIWFYRDLNPNETMATPFIRLNGAMAGVSEPGGAFYRDLAPGHYHIAVDSYVQDPHNEADVTLPPGAEAFAKVLPLDDIVQGGGAIGGGYRRHTYVVWLYPPEIGRPAVARSYFTADGSRLRRNADAGPLLPLQNGKTRIAVPASPADGEARPPTRRSLPWRTS